MSFAELRRIVTPVSIITGVTGLGESVLDIRTSPMEVGVALQ